jgi:hypothetical protein
MNPPAPRNVMQRRSQRSQRSQRLSVAFVVVFATAATSFHWHPSSLTAHAWQTVPNRVVSVPFKYRHPHRSDRHDHHFYNRHKIVSCATTETEGNNEDYDNSQPSQHPPDEQQQEHHQQQHQPLKEYTVQVSYEGRSCPVMVRSDETILAAMERSGTADQLSLPSLPHDCRRGNCLTCTGRHGVKSATEAVQLSADGDGLSPYLSEQFQRRGYVLTCSSHVVAEGVSLELGTNEFAWRDLYQTRLEQDATERQQMGREVLARAIRKRDERNLSRWAAETEAALQKSGEPET